MSWVIATWSGQLVTFTAAGNSEQHPSGIVSLVIGILFFSVGFSFAVNFRGVHRLLRKDGPVPAVLAKLPPWRWGAPDERMRARLVGILFALTGLVAITDGIYRIVNGDA
jgi:hypothetical protein